MESTRKIKKGQIEDFTSDSTILFLNEKENLTNKQNNLTIDGTGVKYPTVDAVRTHTTDSANPHNVTKTKDGCLFGKEGETISSALGKNQRDGTLTKTGIILCWILDKIDKEHCKKSINNNI